MTYSIMAFLSRACVLPKQPATCRHTGTLAGSRHMCSSSGSSAALIPSLPVAPFLDDGLEEDGAGATQTVTCRT